MLDVALELPLNDRAGWLDTACGDDPALREEIEVLLRADVDTGVLDSGVEAFLNLALQDADLGASDDSERLLPGQVLAGRYRVIALLGRGGMGEVYRADDLKLGQAVALKFLPLQVSGGDGLAHQLLREARIARAVSHPNVCRVYDVGEADGHTFLTMEYIDGEDLGSLVSRVGRLPQRQALNIARQLCAGLQAAHDLSVLHRDLKPSNIMLDARGVVRITDFGLAGVIAEPDAAGAWAGTPAYMAPEQLEGEAATRRSDVYALGLVLYEIFTGTRGFSAENIEELRRIREFTNPPRPRALAEGLDAEIEGAILSCLQGDAALRPSSPRAVAEMLPGGDPIHEAREAGETPAPELVAAFGPSGSLQPGHAFGILAAILVMLGVLMLLSDRATAPGWVRWPHSPAALDAHARQILSRLGYADPPLDRARSVITFNDAYRRWVRAHDRSPERWRAIRNAGQWDVLFWYREAPYLLRPWAFSARVTNSDPAPLAGDASLLTDLRGQLIWLEIVPDEADHPNARLTQPDWTALFREAGLDYAGFQPVLPTRNPGVASDARAAWSGTLVNWGGYPVRVEAAAHRGKPVFFELVVPWDPYWNPSAASIVAPVTAFETPMFGVMSATWLTVMPVAALFLAWRNWRSGRGDLRGAFRLAAVVFFLRLIIWILGAHHVPALGDEWILFTIAFGKSLADGAVSWLVYLALEPHARRLHARFLVSWNRLLLRREFHDPLVNRDILYGIALSPVVIASWQLPVVVSHTLGHDAPPPPLFIPLGNLPYLNFLNAPSPEPLLGGRYILEAIASSGLTALGTTIMFLVLLLGLQLLLRSFWVALAICAGLQVMMNPVAEAAGYSLISIACALVAAAVFAASLQFGLIGTLALRFCFTLWMNFPVTTAASTPHFGIGMTAVLIIAGLATLAAFGASRPWRGKLTHA